MRILYVTQIVPYPPHGGVLQRGYNLLRELARHNEVHLLAYHHPDELPHGEAVEASRRELGMFCASLEYFDLWPKRSNVHKLLAFLAAAPYPKPFSVLAHRNAALAERIARVSSGRNRPDIVHLDTIALARYADFCGDLPVAIAHHNVESQLMHRRGEHEQGVLQRSYVQLQADRLERYEAEQCARFGVNIVVSDADAVTLSRICPGIRTAVVPNGVDTTYFTPRGVTESPTIIFTGGMNMFANRDAVEWFLDAVWPQIKRRVPQARFVAIGQRPSQKISDAAAADSTVVVPGHVPDVRTWVAPAAVYVVPMRVGGGTRLKVLDAMAQGKAIVSTTLGAEGIQGEDGRHFVLADTGSDFATRVVELLQDETRRRQLGAEARERVEQRYAWPVIGQQLADVYSAAIETHSR